MSWTRGLPGALAVCVLLLVAAAGCGTGTAHGRRGAESPSPVGKILDRTDESGRHYRELDRRQAPEVGTEVTPDAAGGWDVRIDVRRFRFSPAGTAATAVAGRGLAYLFVDGGLVARLRTSTYHLSAGLVPHGTHHVTARLYADDGTVWAVQGKPVESTADITASGAETATPSAAGAASPAGTPAPTSTDTGASSPDAG
ncbi:hypothetical protein [Streptomyces fuscichromogenes]|uniref:Uncharacterized protein n=1 Tax=Streptomyces fuscichromogenes TaxID=1324013 RepID=A0A917XF21_9ACTN|nr:hypothetical protein [Streptomyces fuscichromogenes]GGN18782.1 hypothetical protein GCM10011578_048220 [Streptomyces fuscichromogenes]